MINQESSSSNFTSLPLAGKSVLVTRPAHQSRDFADSLSKLGAEVWLVPVVEVVPIAVDNSVNLADYDWLIFTSVNGVAAFSEKLKEHQKTSQRFPKLAAIGPATAASLQSSGYAVQAVPDEFISDAIPETLGNIDGTKILIPRAREARKEIITLLEERGAEVRELPVYFSRVNQDQVILDFLQSKVVENRQPDFITLTSSSTVRFLKELLVKFDAESWLKNSTLCCIGPITAGTVSKLGYQPTVVASEYTITGLIEAIRQSLNR